MIKYIIFDLGGVVIDFMNATDYYPYLSKISGVPVKKVAKILDSDVKRDLDKGTMTQINFEREVGRQLGIHENKVRWYDFYVEEAKIYKDTVGVLRRLKKNYQLAYLSNIDRSRYTYTVHKLLKSYLPLFKRKFASCDMGMRKPGQQIYRDTLRHLKIKASEAIFIDNQIENVVGARSVGISSILFVGAKDLEKKLRKLGIKV